MAEAMRNSLYNTFGFPGVIGCVDCTHVEIIAPKNNDLQRPEQIYVNRKNYHSINTQIICDWQLKIIYINARFPSSTQDVYIWRHSNVSNAMENMYRAEHNTFYLLKLYPLRPWLLTPLDLEPDPNTPGTEYNRYHKKIRNILERSNGLLKMRFRCLLKHRVLHYAPEVASKIINACAVLPICALNTTLWSQKLKTILIMAYRQVPNMDYGRINPDLAEARRLQRQLIQNNFT